MAQAEPSSLSNVPPRPGSGSLWERLRWRLRSATERVERRLHRGQTQRPTTERPRRRRWPWIVGLLLLLAAYPVLGTLALSTGLVERFLRSEDLLVEISKPAYTLWPGLVHAKHVKILANGETQFSLAGDDFLVDIRLRDLIKRRVHVTRLNASNVQYQMRVQVKDPRGIERRLAAYPPLPGLPGKNTVHAPSAAPAEPRESEYTVQIEGIDVSVRELWFFEYRYLGDGRLRGGFVVGPNTMEVSTAVQDLGPGELRFGADHVIARNFRGQITAEIPRVNPNEHADVGFLEFVTARTNLRADVVSLANVSAYTPGVEVSRGAGPLTLDLYMDKGWLGPKSHLEFQTDAVRLRGEGFGVDTDLQVRFDGAGEHKDTAQPLPLLRTEAKASYVSLARKDREFTLQLLGHQEELVLDRIRLTSATQFQRGSVRMPSILSLDLDDVSAALPEKAPLEGRGGRARGALKLDLDDKYWLRGPLEFAFEDVTMDAAGVRIHSNAALKTQLQLNPKLGQYKAENIRFSLRDAGMRAGDKQINAWWFDLTNGAVAFSDGSPSQLDASGSMRAKDLEPVLEALAEKEIISDLIPRFVSLGDFRAKARLRHKGEVTDGVIESESDVWDVSGRVHQRGAKTRLAIVVGGQAVSLGVAKAADGLEIMPFAKTGWLNEHLRQMPAPIVQLPASKP